MMDHFSVIFKSLTEKLINECLLEDTSQHFATLKNDFERFKFSLTLLENANLLPNLELKNCCDKNRSESEKFRKEGNTVFSNKRDLDALECYSKSVAFAPLNSEELALAFANRSAVSFSLKRYEDCITDVDRALDGKYPDHLKYKLHERKGKCLLNLGRNEAVEESYQVN